MKRWLIGFIFFIVMGSVFSQDIFDAARKGDVVRMEHLVKINPDTVNARNAADFTPLILSAYYNQIAGVHFLLKHKADIHAGSPEGPVILGACYKGNLELVQLLLEHHANVNAFNNGGTSALMFAVMSGKTQLVKLLLQNGANKKIQDKSGKTALHYAQISESKEIIELLLE